MKNKDEKQVIQKAIKVDLTNSNQEYYFFENLVSVRFTYDKNQNVVKTLARIIPIFDDKFRHEIKKIRYCKKTEVLEVIVNQELIDGNDPSKTELSSNTYFDFKNNDVTSKRILYVAGENYIDEKECYKSGGNIQQPEVKDGNIFTIK